MVNQLCVSLFVVHSDLRNSDVSQSFSSLGMLSNTQRPQYAISHLYYVQQIYSYYLYCIFYNFGVENLLSILVSLHKCQITYFLYSSLLYRFLSTYSSIFKLFLGILALFGIVQICNIPMFYIHFLYMRLLTTTYIQDNMT